MDGGAWWAAGHGVAKSRTRLSDLAAVAAAALMYIKHVHKYITMDLFSFQEQTDNFFLKCRTCFLIIFEI